MSTDDDVFWPTRFINHRHGCDEKHSKRQPCNVPEETPVSTDDLVRRARNMAAATTWPELSALVSELADEVYRLRNSLRETVAARNYAMRQRDEEARAKVGNIDALSTAIIERDAARAALGRVRDRDTLAALIASVDGLAVDAGGKVDGFHYDAADVILNALEGEPS